MTIQSENSFHTDCVKILIFTTLLCPAGAKPNLPTISKIMNAIKNSLLN